LIRWRSRSLWALATAAVAVALALSLVVVAPWKSAPNRPIRHALFRYVERGGRGQPAVQVNLSTSRSLALEPTNEIWFDPRSHLYRLVIRIGGEVSFDGVGQSCLGTSHACPLPTPFAEADIYQQRDKRHQLRTLGSGVVDGHPVDWVATVYHGKANVHEHAALDKRTRELRAVRTLDDQRFFPQENVDLLDRVTRQSVQFPVPKGGASWDVFPPIPSPFTRLPERGSAAARRALGQAPLWLGRLFSGYHFDSVAAGAEGVKGPQSGVTLDSAPVVDVRYTSPHGTLTLDELDAAAGERLWRHEGLAVPPSGYLDFYDRTGTTRRDGLVVRLTTRNLPTAVAAARGLRPLR
jgi:hypothetical protein